MPVIQSEGQLSTVGNGWWPSTRWNTVRVGDYSLDYATMYSKQPALRTVIDFLAKNIGQLGLKTYRRVSDTERQQISDHPLARAIRRPNDYTTRFRFIRDLVSDLALYDNAYIVKVRVPNRLALIQVPPVNMSIEGNNNLRAENYVIHLKEKDLVLPASEVIHLYGYNPNDRRQGLSPVETLRQILAEAAAAGEHRETFWKNSARVDGVLEYPGKLSDVGGKKLRESWQATYSGPENAGKTAILEEGMKFQAITVNAKDSQYLEAKKFTQEEVEHAYQIRMPDDAPYASIEAYHRFLYQDTFGPWLTWIEEELELQLLPEFEDVENVYLEFNIAEKLKGDFESQARAAQASVGAPWMTRNEQRALQNYPPTEGGDELVIPLNVLIGGQASPLDSGPKSIQAVLKTLERAKQVTKSRKGLFEAKRWFTELKNDLSDGEERKEPLATQAATAIVEILATKLKTTDVDRAFKETLAEIFGEERHEVEISAS